jgi:hypothetical protein
MFQFYHVHFDKNVDNGNKTGGWGWDFFTLSGMKAADFAYEVPGAASGDKIS